MYLLDGVRRGLLRAKSGALPVASAGLVVCSSFPALASEAVTPVTADAWKPVLDALTAQVSVSTIVAVLAGIVGAAIGLVFMWWGLRKAVRAIMGAFRKGRLSV